MSSDLSASSAGEYLRRLRRDAGVDLAVLARRLSLSPAQLAELENGQFTLFYSQTIGQQALRKAVLHLGGDVSCLAHAANPSCSDCAWQPSIAARSPVFAPTMRLEQYPRWSGIGWMVGVLSVLLCALAVFAVGHWSAEQGVASSGVKDPAAPDPVGVGASHGVVQPNVSESPLQKTVDAAPLAEPGLLACPPDRADAPVLTPPQASKPGDMVYIVSPVRALVCLVDGSGRSQQRVFDVGHAQAFTGPPPWRVESEQLHQLQLYFQGWKVRLPLKVVNAVELSELR